MHFYRLAPQERRYEEIQPDNEEVVRSETLSGFQFRRQDLWRQPDLAELALDDKYAEYVIPGYLAAVTARIVAEEQAAAHVAARQQAEERAQALEAELARLRQQDS
jgi:very-short-patch-repair endonuclease